MKAVTALRPGGLDVLAYGDVPDPAPGPGEVVVELKAAALNHADLMLREGRLGPLPLIPGHDGAGVVAAVGAGVPQALLGRRVLLNPVASCGACPACTVGDQGSCPERRALGQQLDGTYAEYVKIPAGNALPIADAVGFEAAAAIPSAGFTAWQMLVERADVKPGETVLVTGAGGGVGAAAVQIATLLGARVIASASTAAKLDCARAMGAAELVNHACEPLAERVRELTDGRGCDVIVDTVGAGFWEAYLAAAGRRGRIVLSSSTTGDELRVNVRQLIRHRLTVMGSGPQGSHAVAAAVVRLLNQGRLALPIDRILPLAQAAEAQRALEERRVVGKLLLRPS
jgi:NADPH:quinone reductase-like Zn-dependent oxidoreductase